MAVLTGCLVRGKPRCGWRVAKWVQSVCDPGGARRVKVYAHPIRPDQPQLGQGELFKVIVDMQNMGNRIIVLAQRPIGKMRLQICLVAPEGLKRRREPGDCGAGVHSLDDSFAGDRDERSVALLPFAERGNQPIEDLGNGMVDLLSMAISGADRGHRSKDPPASGCTDHSCAWRAASDAVSAASTLLKPFARSTRSGIES